MADSVSVTITVIEPIVQTYIVNFDIQPRTVARNGALRFTGYLSRNAGAIDDDGIVNGETIEIQILGNGGVWTDTGQRATTALYPNQSYIAGYFDLTFNLDPQFMPAGTFEFRAHYSGNTSKNLAGCE